MAERTGHGIEPPSEWVRRFAGLVAAGGSVLDLAAGNGRHARWLLDAGYRVVAVDRDIAGLRTLSADRLETVAADLEDGTAWPLGPRRFDGVVVANYLHRPLFPAIRAALAPGGVVIYETFAQGNERFGRPRNPDYLLAPGELLGAFAGLRIVAYECGYRDRPKPAMVQRLCALNGGDALPRLEPGG